MNLEIFTLCDAATVHAGKMNVLGSFDTISAEAFPTNHPQCVVACKVRTGSEDEGPQEIRIHIIDPDGRDVIPPVQSRMEGGERLHHHLWHLHGFPLPKQGTYFVDFIANGELLGRNPLFVRQGPGGTD